MPRNLLKRNFYFPRDLKNDQMYLKHGYKDKTEADKISVHFENQSCDFYIYLNQLPSYIVEETKLFQEHSKIANKRGDDEMFRIMGKSIEELEKKVKDLCVAYINESSNIERKKKISVEFNNILVDGSLSIGIKYKVFVEKTYFTADGTIDKIINVDKDGYYESEIKDIRGQVFDYSEELEQNIKNIQNKLYTNMDIFIKMLGEGKNFLDNLKIHNLLENK